VSSGKVLALVVGLLVLIAPAAAWTTSYSWSSSGDRSPFSLFNGLNGPYGMSGPSFGRTSLFSPYDGYSPYSSYHSAPSTTSYSLFDEGMFSDLDDMFDGSLFSAKQYGMPPKDNITKALVGANLSYNRSLMGTPLQFQIDESDIGDITGTQYNGEDAWKVRVGQQGVYWDVILDETGTRILNVSQV
jgi:hypothetical protein